MGGGIDLKLRDLIPKDPKEEKKGKKGAASIKKQESQETLGKRRQPAVKGDIEDEEEEKTSQ